ncbi:MAG TPA: hypothetical protein VHK25_06045 [Acidimicrobiales bacterium]|jgi:hypothetical protein|nr:hypothetical protein [Acidimicrobiales bacterium]
MTNSRIRTLRWIAPVAMAGVLGFAACGGESAAEDARTEARVVSRGSDTHLYNQADQAERVAQAEHLDRVASARAAAAAEQAELDAKLEGSAKTAGVSSGNRAALAAQAERYVEQLEANAESTQDSSSQEFVPGTRHMPVR